MKELIIKKWNWNNGTDFANWMTKQVAYKGLSEFWCWYGDVVKTVSRITSNEHELSALDEVGEHSFDGLPLPSLDTKFSICGKEFEVRDALSLATHEVWYVAREKKIFPQSTGNRDRDYSAQELYSSHCCFIHGRKSGLHRDCKPTRT